MAASQGDDSGIGQAEGYGASAAVVPGTPGPAQPSSPPAPSVSGYGDSAAAVPGTPAPPVYNQHGFWVPTEEDLAKFDQAVATGIPLDGLDSRAKASIYLAKGGDPLQSYDMFRTLVYDPAKDAANQSNADGWKSFQENPLGFAVNKLGDALNFTGQQLGSIGSAVGDVVKPSTIEGLSQIPLKGDGLGDTVRGLAAFGARAVGETEKTGLDMWNSLGAMMEFQPGKAAADWADASQHASNAAVLVGNGIAKGSGDVAQQITTTGQFMGHLASGTLANIPGLPPDVKDAVNEQDARMTYGLSLFQRNMNTWTDDFSNKAASALAQTGLVSKAMTDQIKLSSGQITPAQLEGSRTFFNPANWIGPAEATKGIGLAAKPAFMQAVQDSGQAISNLKAEETSAMSRIGAAQVIKQAAIDGRLGDSGQIIADLREQQAAAASNLSRAQDARTANLPPDGGSPHSQFDADIAIAHSRLDGVAQQLDQAVANHPTPATPMPPEFDNQIAAAQNHLQGVRSDIAQATKDHQQIVINAGNALQRNIGVASQAASALAQGTGAAIGKAADIGNAIGTGINNWTLKLANGDPVAAAAIRHYAPDLIGAVSGLMHGGLGEAGEGGFLAHTMGFMPKLNQVLEPLGLSVGKVGYNLSVLGKEFGVGEATSSFANRLGQKLVGVPQTIAKALDFSAFNDVTRTASGAINSAVEAGGLNAALGYMGNGGNPGAAGQSLISGSILGFGGGMSKVWRDFNSPESLQSAQVNDRYRFLQSLDGDTAAQFKKLHPEAQLSIGSYASQHPDLRWKFDAAPGSGGSYNVDTGAKTGTIHLDPSQPNSLGPVVAHEFSHFIMSRGMGPEIVSKLLGTPETNTPGLFTKLDDATGKPVRMANGDFQPNDNFLGLHEKLRQSYLDAGHTNEPMSYERTAKELAAESAVGWVSPGSVIPQKTLIGHLMNLGVSGSVTKPFVKEAIAAFGNGFGSSGDSIHGTGLFTGEKRIPLVDDLMREWYDGKRKLGPLDSGDSVNIHRKDLAGLSDADIRNIVGPVDGFKTDANGKIVRGSDNAPVMRKGKDALQKMGQQAGQQVQQAITEMGETARQRAGIISDGDRGWTLPPTADLDGLFKGKLPNQMIQHMKIWSGLGSTDPGAGISGRYWAAYKRGRNREPIPDSIPLKPHSVMPLALTVTKEGNILGHALDHGQLAENAQIAVKKGLGSEYNFDAPKMVQSARTMLEAISRGQPAESVVSPGQKRLLYELTGIDPKINGTDVFHMPPNERSQSTYKTYRMDRWANLQVDPSQQWKLKQGLYDDLVGYKSGNLQRDIPPRDLQNTRQAPYFSRGAAAATTQSAPYSSREGLARPAMNYVRQVAEPPTQQASPVSAPRAQPVAPRAELVAPRAQPAQRYPTVDKYFQSGQVGSPKVEAYLQDIADKEGEPAMKRILARTVQMDPRYLESGQSKYFVPQVPKDYESKALESLKSNRQILQQGTDLDQKLGGLLRGHGVDFALAGHAHGVDPYLLAAISQVETASGTSHLLRTRNNTGGLTGAGYNGVGGNYRPFNSISDSIHEQARMIRHGYLDQGRNSIESIGAKWAPGGGVSNDPRNTNSQWPRMVRQAYSRLTETASR